MLSADGPTPAGVRTLIGRLIGKIDDDSAILEDSSVKLSTFRRLWRPVLAAVIAGRCWPPTR